jgi:hypothetical protein
MTVLPAVIENPNVTQGLDQTGLKNQPVPSVSAVPILDFAEQHLNSAERKLCIDPPATKTHRD